MTPAAPTKPELMARRRAADGTDVQFWTDGEVTTGGLGTAVPGTGPARTPAGRDLDRQACWLLAGEVGVYGRAELPAAVKAARRAVRAFAGHPDRLRAFRLLMNPPAAAGRPHPRACDCPRCFAARPETPDNPEE